MEVIWRRKLNGGVWGEYYKLKNLMSRTHKALTQARLPKLLTDGENIR
jgi:hypothetical protein